MGLWFVVARRRHERSYSLMRESLMIMHKNSLSAPRLLNGLKLLAILPPLGIAWLIYLSRGQWLQLIKRPKSFGRDPF